MCICISRTSAFGNVLVINGSSKLETKANGFICVWLQPTQEASHWETVHFMSQWPLARLRSGRWQTNTHRDSRGPVLPWEAGHLGPPESRLSIKGSGGSGFESTLWDQCNTYSSMFTPRPCRHSDWGQEGVHQQANWWSGWGYILAIKARRQCMWMRQKEREKKRFYFLLQVFVRFRFVSADIYKQRFIILPNTPVGFLFVVRQLN